MDLLQSVKNRFPSTPTMPKLEEISKSAEKISPKSVSFLKRRIRLRGNSNISIPLGVVLLFPCIVLIVILVIFVRHSDSPSAPFISTGAPPTIRKINEKYDKVFVTGCRDPATQVDQPRANAAFVVLARNKELDGVLQSIKSIERHFNRWFHYPYVFLNDGEFNSTFRETIANYTSAPVEFGQINSTMWGYPDWVDKNVAQEGIRKQGDAAIMYGGMESYHHMCRFYSGFFFKHELLQKYKWYWRLEPEIKYFCDITYDPFIAMEKANKTYGFTIIVKELKETVPNIFRYAAAYKNNNNLTSKGLWELFLEPKSTPQDDQFEDELNQKPLPDEIEKIDPAAGTLPPIDGEAMEGETYNMCHFWSNFEIARLDWFRSKEYQEFFDTMDRSGGFWMERWGDAPIHSLAAGALLAREDIHYFRDFGYRHTTIQHCPANAPARQLPREPYLEMTTKDKKARLEEDDYWATWDKEQENGVGCRCRCDTDIAEVEDKEGSCTPEWVETMGGWITPSGPDQYQQISYQPSFIQKRRIRHIDWTEKAADFDTIHLDQASKAVPNPTSLFIMTADPAASPKVPGITQPEDFDYVITLDEGFETIDASRRPHLAAPLSSASDVDSHSESGETIETVSAYGQSDAATVASVGSDMGDSHGDLSSDSLRFPDPTSPLVSQTLPGEQGMTASMMSMPESETVDDQEWSAVRDSEITIKGSKNQSDQMSQEQWTDIQDTERKESLDQHIDASTKASEDQYSQEKADNEDYEMQLALLWQQNKRRLLAAHMEQAAKKHQELSDDQKSETATGDAAGSINTNTGPIPAAPCTLEDYQLQLNLLEQQNKRRLLMASKGLPVKDVESLLTHQTFLKSNGMLETCRSHAAKSVWRICIGFLIAILLWYTPSFGVFPVSRQVASHTEVIPKGLASVHKERKRRHLALAKALTSNGLAYTNGTAINVQDILVYPVLKDPYLDDLHISAPTAISVVADVNQLFISVPKDPKTRKYPQQPEIRSLDSSCKPMSQEGCKVKVAKQVELIDGLTYVLLDIPDDYTYPMVSIRSGSLQKVIQIKPSSEALAAFMAAIGGAKSASKIMSEKLQSIAKDARAAGSVLDQNRRRWFNISMAHANKTMTRLVPELYVAKEQLQKSLRASMSTVKAFANRTEVVDFWKIPKGFHWKKTPSFGKVSEFVGRAESNIPGLYKQTTVILSRAQRNGIGIAQRVGGNLQAWLKGRV